MNTDDQFTDRANAADPMVADGLRAGLARAADRVKLRLDLREVEASARTRRSAHRWVLVAVGAAALILLVVWMRFPAAPFHTVPAPSSDASLHPLGKPSVGASSSETTALPVTPPTLSALAGMTWRLDHAVRSPRAPLARLPITISFTSDLHGFSFTGGCNVMTGRARIVEGRLLTSGIGGILRGCLDEPVIAQDGWLNDLVTHNPALELQGDQLTLTGDAAELVFVRA